MTSVAVLGLGRMGAAMAARLADVHDVRTWTRSAGGSPTVAVEGADVVLLCLYDGPACRDVLAAVLPALSARTTVVNTTTVGPDEAVALDALVATTGAAYLHAPVMGSTPAVAAGRLTILAGGKPSAEVDEVLGVLGETLVFGGPAEAAGAQARRQRRARRLAGLAAPGPRSWRRARPAARRGPRRGRAVGPRPVRRRPARRAGCHGGAAGGDVRRRCPGQGPRPARVRHRHGVRRACRAGHAARRRALSRPTTTSAWSASRPRSSAGWPTPGSTSRPRSSPTPTCCDRCTPTPSRTRPATRRTSTTPSCRPRTSRGTATASSCPGPSTSSAACSPARRRPTRPARSRRIERLDVRGSVATAVMTLHHGDVDFTDVFVLLRDPGSGRWRIASKAYERRAAGR